MPNWPIEPDAAGVVSFINYSIFFSDIEEYNTAVETFGGNYVLRSPAHMRDTLSVPMDAVWGDEKWFYFYAPPYVMDYNLDGTWADPLPIAECKAYMYPHDPGETPYWWPPLIYTFDWAQDWNGAPAYPTDRGWGRGVAVSWIWACTLTMSGGVVIEPEGEYEDIRPRRFFTGFEVTNGGQDPPADSPELDGGTVWSEAYSRCASRTPDGLGFACRSSQSSVHLLDEQGTITNAKNSWERFYMRVIRYPTVAADFWTMHTNGSEVLSLTIGTDGTLNAFTINNFAINSGPLGAGSQLALNSWYRIDIYMVLQLNPVTGCDVSLTLSGRSAYAGGASLTVEPTLINTGFGPIQRTHGSSQLGPRASGQGFEIDFDDWSNMDPGDPDTPEALTYADTIDYEMGHHVQLIRNTGFSDDGTWTGDYRATEQSPTAHPIATLDSSASGDGIEMTTEVNGEPMGPIAAVRQLGPLAFNALAAISKASPTVTDLLGMSLAGVLATSAKSLDATLQGYAELNNIASDLAEPLPPLPAVYEPANPYYAKSTDAVATEVSLLMLEAQFCGCFGPEDGSDPDTIFGSPDQIGYHNSPYYTSLLGRAVLPSINTVGVASGTYVGNGTGQDIEIVLPGIHWLYIRNTSTSDKTWWWSTMLGPHANSIGEDILPGLAVRVTWPETGNTLISLVGDHVSGNANGITYQYVAFSDVASRILLNTTWRHSNDDMNNALFNSEFLPEFVMLQQETVKNVSLGDSMIIKGPGMTDDAAKWVDEATIDSDVMTLETGNIVSRADITTGVVNNAAACFRAWDGGTSVPNIIYIGQYTGDGTGNRDISTPLNERRPIFAIISPFADFSPSWSRDASHSSNMSSRVYDGTSVNTAIRGGDIDIVKVGTTLNANGVVYSIMVFPSCSDEEGNDGWGIDNACGIAEPGWGGPTQPDYPSWSPDIPDIPADIAVAGSGGLVLSGETAKLIILDLSGIYTIVPGKTNDTLLDRQVGQESIDVKIPDPLAKTGYIGG